MFKRVEVNNTEWQSMNPVYLFYLNLVAGVFTCKCGLNRMRSRIFSSKQTPELIRPLNLFDVDSYQKLEKV